MATYEKSVDQFSQGAMLESMQHLETGRRATPEERKLRFKELYPPKSTPDPAKRPASYYEEAYEGIVKSLENRSNLRQNKVLGNALTIKALAEWKTGRTEDAKRTCGAALTALESEEESSPRDIAVMTALPGLVDIDICFDTARQVIAMLDEKAETAENLSETEAADLFKQIKAHYDQFISGEAPGSTSLAEATVTIGKGLPPAAANKEVQRYLIMTQLTGLKTWTDELSKIDNFAKLSGHKARDENARQWIGEQWTKYRSMREKKLQELASVLPDGTDSETYQFWKDLL